MVSVNGDQGPGGSAGAIAMQARLGSQASGNNFGSTVAGGGNPSDPGGLKLNSGTSSSQSVNGGGNSSDPGGLALQNNHDGVINGKNSTSSTSGKNSSQGVNGSGSPSDPGGLALQNNHDGVISGKNSTSSTSGQNSIQGLIAQNLQAVQAGDNNRSSNLLHQLEQLGVQMPR